MDRGKIIQGELKGAMTMKNTRLCDFRCMSAVGPECNCSCLGVNHGCYNAAVVLPGMEHGAKVRDHSMMTRSKLKPTMNEDNQPRLF